MSVCPCFPVLDEDYSLPSPFTVVFGSGSTVSSPASITIIDDLALEETMTSFTVRVNSSDAPRLPLDAEASVTITDNEGTCTVQVP